MAGPVPDGSLSQYIETDMGSGTWALLLAG